MASEVITNTETEVREVNVVDTPTGQSTEVKVEAKADLLTEYVGAAEVGYGATSDNRYLRALPHPSDSLMRDFGSRLYDIDMPTDAQVYSTLSILVMSLLAEGYHFNSPLKDDDPDYEASLDIVEFIYANIRGLKHSFPEIMYELAEGMLKMGHKVGEQIYQRRTLSQLWGERTCLVDIKTKPHESTAFVADGYNEVLGLMYIRPGKPLSWLRTSIIAARSAQSSQSNPDNVTATGQPEQDDEPVLIPRAKFAIPTHKPRNGDPRGTSHVRPVYAPWWKKQQWNPQHLAYVTRFAQPSAVAKLSKDAKDIPVKAPDGTVTGYKSIVTMTTAALAKIKGGAVGSFIDTDVALLQATGNGEVIFKSYDHEDRQIAKGILMQTLTTEESAHMARAASSIHQDVFGILISFLRSVLEWSIRHDIVYWLVRYNYGEEAAIRMLPEVSLGDTAVQDIPKLMAAYAQIANTKQGIVHRSMRKGIRRQLNMPPANDKQEAEDDAKADALAEQLAKAAMQPKSGPGTEGGGGNDNGKGTAPKSDDTSGQK